MLYTIAEVSSYVLKYFIIWVLMKYQDKKIISSSRAVKILFLSFTCEDIGVAMVTYMISQLQESFPFLIKF